MKIWHLKKESIKSTHEAGAVVGAASGTGCGLHNFTRRTREG